MMMDATHTAKVSAVLFSLRQYSYFHKVPCVKSADLSLRNEYQEREGVQFCFRYGSSYNHLTDVRVP